MALVSLRSVAKSLQAGVCILDDLDLSVDIGQSLAIVGRSGSGKSTLLSILGLLDTADRGTYVFEDRDVSIMSTGQIDALRGTRIGFVFQRFALFPHLNALENVMTPLRHASRLSERQMRASAHEALDAVGMAAHAKRQPRRLSGGEQQRVAIARALVHRPALILADEPTGALDQVTGDSVISLLADGVQSGNAALIVVTHDPEVASRMGRRAVLIGGRLQEDSR